MPLFTAFRFRWQRFLRKGATTILAFSWIVGLVSGFLLSYHAGDSLCSLMRGCVYSSVSIVWFLSVSIFPFLFSALAVFLSFPQLLFVICFIKALLYGFLFVGLDFAWGSAAWLIRIAVLLDDLILMPICYWFWHIHISGEKKCSVTKCGLIIFGVILVVFGIDRLTIPFFADVFIL